MESIIPNTKDWCFCLTLSGNISNDFKISADADPRRLQPNFSSRLYALGPGWRLDALDHALQGAVLEWLSYSYAAARHGDLATC